MSIDDLIDAIIKAEGGSKFTDSLHDAGGRTQYGISEAANPSAWADGHVTEEEAREIYLKKYVKGPGFDGINDPHLQHFLVDFGVTSGPVVAIRELQRTLKVDVDGVLGPETLAACNGRDPRRITNDLVGARLKMIGRIVQKNPSQLKWLSGWINRCIEFIR